MGSKYAIICGALKSCDFMLDLNNYVIPIGNSKGKLLSEYIKARVDKACGQYKDNWESLTPNLVKISYYAEIISLYAVYVK